MSPPGTQPAFVQELMASRMGLSYHDGLLTNAYFNDLQTKRRFHEAGKSVGRLRSLNQSETVKG
jgi:hypothetical protein